jgi:hypothetical protein
MGLLVACTGGGGSLATGSSGTSGSGPSTSSGGGDPVSECQEFVTLSADCYRKAGREIPANSAACSSDALDGQQLAQVECALASRDAYCLTIVATTSRDAGDVAALASNPDVLKLNACIASRATASPCKEAVLALADCGAATGYEPACNEPSRSMAKCVVDNVQGACAFFKPHTGTVSPEAQKYLDCQLAAARAGRDASP